MKTAEEKIQFKNHFFKLGQGRVISLDDVKYWLVFWSAPLEASDVYDLLSSYDVQTVRDHNLPNFLLFIRILCIRVVHLSKNSTSQKHHQLINCLRLLTKLLPYVFELPNYADIESRLFWDPQFDPLDFLPVRPPPVMPLVSKRETSESEALAYTLTCSLVLLLFTEGFTISESCAKSTPLTLWEPGVGASAKYEDPNPIHDCNRSEVLRLLITLTSTSLYVPAAKLTSQGSMFLTILVSSLSKSDLYNLLFSLLNLTCRSARSALAESGLAYENLSLGELRHFCVTYSAQLLAAMLVYPMPSQENSQFLQKIKATAPKPHNMVRLLFGKLGKEAEVKFMASHLLTVLKYPTVAQQDTDHSKRSKGSGQPSLWALESMIILWELLQCNKALHSIGDRFVPRLVPYLLYHVSAFYDVPQHHNLARIASYFLLYISSQEPWVHALVSAEAPSDIFSLEDKTDGKISTRDLMVIQICQFLPGLISGPSYRVPPNSAALQSFVLPMLVEVLYNIIPSVNDDIEGTNDAAKGMSNTNPQGGLSYLACSALTLLLIRLSAKQFLLEGPTNAQLLALTLRALCSAAAKSPQSSRMLLFSFLKNEKTYDKIWNVIYGLNNEYFSGGSLKLMNVDEDDEEKEEVEPPKRDFGPLSRTNSSEKGIQMRPVDQAPNTPTMNDDHHIFNASLNSSVASVVTSTLVEDDESAAEDEDKILEAALRPTPPSGMSQKAWEKLPRDSPLNKSWGGNDALRIIITVLIPNLKANLKEVWSKRGDCNYDDFFIVKQIEHCHFEDVIKEHKSQLSYDFLPDSPVDMLLFSWSPMSLGWYLSTLYWNVYNAQDNVKQFVRSNNTLMKNISSSIAVFSKFASSWSGFVGNSGSDAENVTHQVETSLNFTNVWAATNVKLLKAKGSEGDRFFNPFNLKFGNSVLTAGNDIANSLVRRFSDFRTSSRSSIISANLNIDEDPPRLSKRNSVTSLHSLNTLNRTRSNTPRNSISI